MINIVFLRSSANLSLQVEAYLVQNKIEEMFMARMTRQESRSRIYHVIARGNNSENVFKKALEKQQFLLCMEYAGERVSVELYAYCIMDNHVHFMMRAELQELSSYMQVLLSRYAMYYNHRNGRQGHVFQGRFESECIEKESGFWSCMRYIHNHPLWYADMKNFTQYPYSSFREYTQKKLNLVHPSGRKYVKMHYRTQRDFLAFHQLLDEKWFVDLEEEERWQKYVVLKMCLKTFLDENQILPGEFLLNMGHRKQFEETIHTRLHLSYRQIREIFELICMDISFL